MRLRVIASLVLYFLVCFAVSAQDTPQPNAGAAGKREALLRALPPAVRTQARALLDERDDRKRADLAEDLTETGRARAFILYVLETDQSSRVRSDIIDKLDSQPDSLRALELRVVDDRDVEVALRALDKLRTIETRRVRQLLIKRIEASKRNGRDEETRRLARESERWISLARGTMLPAFMRVTPPVFSIKPADESVRVLAFGDFGNGTVIQKEVAAAMLKFHGQTPFDFAITLGDNFYSVGMESPADPRWKTWYEDLYDPLTIKFYATLGNHDWGHPDSPAAELMYAHKSESWRMPAPYYTFTAGPVQFFALDTNEVSEAQLLWLSEELKKSRAQWKVVHGHHPIISAGAHDDDKTLIARLLPVLKGRADVYIAGHDHDLQHLRPEGGLHFFVAGGGGAGIRPMRPDPRSLFAKSSYGFAVIEADQEKLNIRFLAPNLEQLYAYTLTKRGQTAVTPTKLLGSRQLCPIHPKVKAQREALRWMISATRHPRENG